MAKIGDGVIAAGTQAWPGGVDTRETFENNANPGADTTRRLDAEVINDLGEYVLKIAAALGTDPRLGKATVQAVLDDFEARIAALEP